MRIGYLIGALHAGGSERQLSQLATGLAARNHDVRILSYDGSGDFDTFVQERGVGLDYLDTRTRLSKTYRARQWVKSFKPNILHGFMKRASSLAVLTNIRRNPCGLIGSDFSTATYDPNQAALRVALQLFRFADRVVTQTEVNRRSLQTLAPWLRGKTAVIRNGVDLQRFRPRTRSPGDRFKFLCVGTVWKAKNPLNVVKAARHLQKRIGDGFRLRWVGKHFRGDGGAPTPECREAMDFVERHKMSEIVSFPGPTDDVEREYRTADALVHASIQDGIPNAVVEGMACGLPVVLSRVSDLPLIVEEGCNGFLCHASDSESISEAMHQMIRAEPDDLRAMGQRSRELATSWFGYERFLDDYEELYRRVSQSAE